MRGTPGAGLGIQEIALAIFAAHNYPEGIEPSIDAEATFDPENFSFPHGTHICAMEVDTETGFVKIRKYACVDDVGDDRQPADRRGADPRRARAGHRAGPVRGGGLRRRRQPDHRHVRRLPACRRPSDLPHFDTGNTVHAATSNPLGAKGVGEAGCIASTPAVVNAALDAVRHLGVSDILMPLTPERVWRAIHQGGDGGGRATAGTTAYGGASTESSSGESTDASSLGGDR